MVRYTCIPCRTVNLLYGSRKNTFSCWHWGWNWGRNSSSSSKLISKQVSAKDISDIDLDTTSADIDFRKSSDSNIRAIIYAPSNYKQSDFNITQDNGDFKIAQDSFAKNLFWFGDNTVHIEVDIPDSYGNDLNVHNTSGDCRFMGDFSLRNVSLNQTSGDFDANALSVQTLTCKETSGDTRIASINAQKYYNVSAQTGDLHLDEVSGAGSINNTTGDVTVNYKNISGESRVSATTGDINIGLREGCNTEYDASATLGDIRSDLSYDDSDHDNRHIHGKFGNGPLQDLDAVVTTGDITINRK